jgi:hypothetical protein
MGYPSVLVRQIDVDANGEALLHSTIITGIDMTNHLFILHDPDKGINTTLPLSTDADIFIIMGINDYKNEVIVNTTNYLENLNTWAK